MSENDWKYFKCGYGEGWSVENEQRNKKCGCVSKTGIRKNKAGNYKEHKKKLARPLAERELPAEECSRTQVRKSGTLCHS